MDQTHNRWWYAQSIPVGIEQLITNDAFEILIDHGETYGEM